MRGFRRKQRVRWRYDHYVPSLGRYKVRLKQGAFMGLCSHSSRYWRVKGRGQLALVLFDGNRKPSRVPLDKLTADLDLKIAVGDPTASGWGTP